MKIRHLTYFIMLNFINQRAYFQRISYKFNEVLLYVIFAKFLNICKQVSGNLVNESGNVPRRGVVPRFSDLEIVALNMTSEAAGIDSESLLLSEISDNKSYPNQNIIPT